jgi:hypothetical protein
MKLVGWMSMMSAMVAGTAIAQVDVVGANEAAETDKVVVPADLPETHNVQEGDTLWDITGRYYGDPYQWPKVWSYNPDITNPHWIYPDSQVRLRPGDEQVIKTAPRGFAPPRAGGPQAIRVTEYGYLDERALEDAGYIISANEEHMMLSDTDMTYVRFNKGVKPEVGRVYTVFREIYPSEREPSEKGTLLRKIESERAPPEKGRLIRIFGGVRLQDYDEEHQIGRALLVDSLDAIERGFRLTALERKFYWVDVVPADQSLNATVVANLYPLKLPSLNQVVFVDVGSEKGIVLGNRFHIVRQGDEWRRSSEWRVGREVETSVPLPDPPEYYPWEVVAIGRAVDVQPTTTAVLIEKATREVRMGDRAELRKGE